VLLLSLAAALMDEVAFEEEGLVFEDEPPESLRF
jgi:hypothetical protein